MLTTLRAKLQDQSIKSCADLSASSCSDPGNTYVRFACPQRCQCNHPAQGGFYLLGCPVRHCAASQGWIDNAEQFAFATREEDIPQPVLAAWPEWKLYWDTYAETMAQFSAENNVGVDPLVVKQIFMDEGCRGMKRVQNMTGMAEPTLKFFCDEQSQRFSRRPLRPFCPETCFCNERLRPNDRFCLLYPSPSSYPCTSGQDLSVRDTMVVINRTLNYSIDGLYACMDPQHELTFARRRDAKTPRYNRISRRRTDLTRRRRSHHIGFAPKLSYDGYFVGSLSGHRNHHKWIMYDEIKSGAHQPLYYTITAIDELDLLQPIRLPAQASWIAVNSSNTPNLRLNHNQPILNNGLQVSRFEGSTVGGKEFFGNCSFICNEHNLACTDQLTEARWHNYRNDDAMKAMISRDPYLSNLMNNTRPTCHRAAWEGGGGPSLSWDDSGSGYRCTRANKYDNSQSSWFQCGATQTTNHRRRGGRYLICYCHPKGNYFDD